MYKEVCRQINKRQETLEDLIQHINECTNELTGIIQTIKDLEFLKDKIKNPETTDTK